jgi:superfamily I DNA/RNA helicase
MQLNEEQMAAATHPPGEAALLLAGAGSGKTATLTERISWLIEQGVPARKILAITFTNKAAKEIEERVTKRLNLPMETVPPRITTIHSLALSMIRRNPEGFHLQKGVTPLDEYNQKEMLKDIIAKMVKENEALGQDSNMNQYRLAEMISFHRARGVGFVKEYTDEVHQKSLVEHAGYHALTKNDLYVWYQYEQTKRESNQIDFDDMIHFAVRRGTEDHAWREALQKVFAHVIMDESQDTNIPQWALVNMLLGSDNRNLMIIGDLGQSIYGFSGACPALITAFSEDWRGAPPVLYRIVRNHRSVPEVVKLANRIQESMTATIPLRMECFRGDVHGHKGKAAVIKAESPRDIGARIAQTIADARSLNPNLSYRDYCILIRSGMQLRDIEGEMIRNRIPYIVRGGKGLLQTEEVRDILAYMRLATNPKDFQALKRASGAPKRKVGDVTLETLRRKAASEHGGDLVAACLKLPKLQAFADIIRVIQRSKMDPLLALEEAIRMSGYHAHLKSKYAKDPEKIIFKLENLARLRDMIQGLTEDMDVTTEDLVFQLTMDRPEQDDKLGKVTISTIHASKGLEYKVVWVTNIHEGSIPHKWSLGSEAELEEERRLLYVAVTRAKDTVYLCLPRTTVLRTERLPNGGAKQIYGRVDPSRFLVELGIVPPPNV